MAHVIRIDVVSRNGIPYVVGSRNRSLARTGTRAANIYLSEFSIGSANEAVVRPIDVIGISRDHPKIVDLRRERAIEVAWRQVGTWGIEFGEFAARRAQVGVINPVCGKIISCGGS